MTDLQAMIRRKFAEVNMPLVNEGQPIRRSILSPAAVYSRVVSCVVFVPTGPGAVYAVTLPVGQRVWLWKVTVRLLVKAADATRQTLFRVYTGTTAVASAAEIGRWQNVLPLVSVGFRDEPWTAYDGRDEFEWTMRRLYVGEGRRFGVWAERGPLGADEISASFEVSEG